MHLVGNDEVVVDQVLQDVLDSLHHYRLSAVHRKAISDLEKLTDPFGLCSSASVAVHHGWAEPWPTRSIDRQAEL